MFTKKAVSELLSFSFITLIIVIASSSAYIYSKNVMEENINNLDRNRMESYLKTFDAKINKIMAYDNVTVSQELSFRKGTLAFNRNSIVYTSLVPFEGSEDSCFNSLCYKGEGGVEILYKNITSPYIFTNNITLEPGRYILIMEHDKTNQKIKISFN